MNLQKQIGLVVDLDQLAISRSNFNIILEGKLPSEHKKYLKKLDPNDWNQLPDWANYRCYSEAGYWRCFEEKPGFWSSGWVLRKGKSMSLGKHPKRKNIDWYESLEKREWGVNVL